MPRISWRANLQLAQISSMRLTPKWRHYSKYLVNCIGSSNFSMFDKLTILQRGRWMKQKFVSHHNVEMAWSDLAGKDRINERKPI